MIFTVETKGLERVFQRLSGFRSAFRSEKVWAEIGARIRANILLRTARGVDADGKAFDGYSSGYALYRKKHGRPTKKPNLFWSGTMLNSLDVDASDHGARLYFQPTQAPNYPVGKHAKKPRVSPKSPAKAYYLHYHRTKPRKFFAFSKKDVQQAKEFLLQVLKNA